MKTETVAIYLIASNEFNRIIRHPLVFVILCILFILAVLNGAGGSYGLQYMQTTHTEDVFISVGMSQNLSATALFCSAFAAFLGTMSIIDEKSKGSLSLLLTKPLYRRDLVIGKLTGMSMFILTFIIVALLMFSIFITIFFRAPYSLEEFVTRISTFVLLLFFECSITMGIGMLAGILFNNRLQVAMIVITYLFIDWYCYLTKYMGDFKFISPSYLFFHVFWLDSQTNLLDTSIPYLGWLDMAWPYIFLLVLEMFVLIALNCMLSIKLDT